jgi:hypothetical protein
MAEAAVFPFNRYTSATGITVDAWKGSSVGQFNLELTF